MQGPGEFADGSSFNIPNGADERRRRAAPGRVDVSGAAHRGGGRRKRCLRPHARLRHQICEARRVVRKILGVPPALVPADSMRKKIFEEQTVELNQRALGVKTFTARCLSLINSK